MTLSPGLTEVAKVQNISIKGTLSGCTGGTGTSASYLMHLKTSTPETRASLTAGGGTAEGTSLLKWGKGKGNSQGTLKITGDPMTVSAWSGIVESGPLAALGISSPEVSGSPVFKSKASCTGKKGLKTITLTGTTPFEIS